MRQCRSDLLIVRAIFDAFKIFHLQYKNDKKLSILNTIILTYGVDASTARAKSRTELLIHFQLFAAGFNPSGQPTKGRKDEQINVSN